MSESKSSNPKDACGTKKVPFSLIPENVIAEIGLAFLEGSRKYGANNWRVDGVRASVYLDALRRHLGAWQNGEDIDPDSGLSHLVKAMACLIILRDSMAYGNMVDDRPPKLKEGWVQELNKKAAEIIEKYPEGKEPYTEKSVTKVREDYGDYPAGAGTPEHQKVLSKLSKAKECISGEEVQTEKVTKVNKFKIGDRVQVCKRGPIGWEKVDWSEKLSFNETYVVTAVYARGGISVTGSPYVIHPNHFELSTSDMVTFAYTEKVKKVIYITGSFNEWGLEESKKLVRDPKTGDWKVSFSLPKGTHTYQFIVDGAWIEDPDNPNKERNSYGDVNSILVVS